MDMAMTTPPGRRRRPQASPLPAAKAAHKFLLGPVSHVFGAQQTEGVGAKLSPWAITVNREPDAAVPLPTHHHAAQRARPPQPLVAARVANHETSRGRPGDLVTATIHTTSNRPSPPRSHNIAPTPPETSLAGKPPPPTTTASNKTTPHVVEPLPANPAHARSSLSNAATPPSSIRGTPPPPRISEH
nr:formin-like protein 5 [Aegilops tauschii subsp. strangulata]